MKIIKFDTIYPMGYLNQKINDNYKLVKKMSFQRFHSWLIALRMNYSDFYKV